MSGHNRCILWLLYNIRPRRALDVEEIRKKCKIEDWEIALKLCVELQHDGKIIGAKTPKGWVFWTDFTENLEHAVRIPCKHQPNQNDRGTISIPNSPITDGSFRLGKSPTRGE